MPPPDKCFYCGEPEACSVDLVQDGAECWDDAHPRILLCEDHRHLEQQIGELAKRMVVEFYEQSAALAPRSGAAPSIADIIREFVHGDVDWEEK